ncbi:hypothetical protein BJX63DRAFT_97943 [Aspergillus granulosus]|uniref:Zn(2)-C6 fungal-type domain-containing protein n=1 Tax=Aspergillus granulosus TaxID=176169 RepID=A0ABR4GUW3_9EURO
MIMQTMQSACEPCRSSKRKCDRVIPACSRCTRVARCCYYDLQRLPENLQQRLLTDRTKLTSVISFPGLRDICPITFRWYMPRLIKHYHESLESSQVESSRKSTAYMLQSVWLQHALSDPCLFHVTLYIGSSYFDHRNGDAPSSITLYHQTEILRNVNERLSDPLAALDDRTIASVALLALFSSLSGDQTASQVHTAGLRRLIGLKGGNNKLGFDGLLGTLIHINELLQGIIFDLKSDLFPQGYHVVPPIGLESRILEYRALPYRILDIDEPSTTPFVPGDPTLELFRGIHDFKLEVCRSGNSIASAQRMLDKISLRDRLHTSAAFLLSENPVDSCCVLAASIFWFLMDAHARCEAGSAEMLNKLGSMARELKAALSLVEDIAWLKSNPIAYCWVCMVGAAVACDTKMRVWFWVRQAPIMRVLNTVDDFGFLDDIWVHIIWLRSLTVGSWVHSI